MFTKGKYCASQTFPLDQCMVSCLVQRMAVFQASLASSLSSVVCSESDVFGKGILNKLIPSYRLLYGQLKKAQFCGMIYYIYDYQNAI